MIPSGETPSVRQERDPEPREKNLSGATLEELKDALDDDLRDVSAATELASRGSDGVKVLMSSLNQAGARRQSLIALSRLAALGQTGKDASPAICELLLTTDTELRTAAAKTLLMIGAYPTACGKILATVLRDTVIDEVIDSRLDDFRVFDAFAGVPPLPHVPADSKGRLQPARPPERIACRQDYTHTTAYLVRGALFVRYPSRSACATAAASSTSAPAAAAASDSHFLG